MKPWQINGVAFMHGQEESRLNAGIVADACGLGKTLLALSFLVLMARNQAPSDGPFRPSLVLCPPTLLDTWLTEAWEELQCMSVPVVKHVQH